MIILQLSEQMGLLHTSKGQEPERYIEVRKHTLCKDQTHWETTESSEVSIRTASLELEEGTYVSGTV